MFALCGVMIIVGIVYIRSCARPGSVGGGERRSPGRDGRLDRARNARPGQDDLPGRGGGGASEQSTVTPRTPSIVTSPPTTTARVTVPASSPTTVTPPPTTLVTTTTAVPVTTTTLLSITLTASPPLIVPGAPPLAAPPIGPPPTAAPAARVYAHSDSGIASWFNAPDNTCAHRTLPFGTMVKVTRPSNGSVAFCKVDDRGPTLATGRLIDLSMDTFSELAAPESGLIDVDIEW